VFTHLPAGNMVLKAMIDTYCYRFDRDTDNEAIGEVQCRTQFPNSFFLGVMLRYMGIKEHDVDAQPSQCDYHGHTLGGT
jgi:hypothetical protein